MAKNHDLRLKIAHRIVKLCKKCEIVKVHKVTRAGTTTSTSLALLEQGHTILIPEPTNRIIQNTILKDIKKLSSKNPVIVHIPANHACLIIARQLEENDLLRELPYHLFPVYCRDCDNFDKCPMTEIIRVEHLDIVSLTYDKLAALMLSAEMNPEGIAAEILAKIEENVDAIVLDEAHELMYHRVASVAPHESDKINNKIERLAQLEGKTGGSLQRLRLLLLAYHRLTHDDNVQGNFKHLECVLEEEDSSYLSWGKLQAVSLPNPCRNIELECDFETEHALVYQEIVELAQTCGGFEIDDILELCDILSIVAADHITLELQKKMKTQDGEWLLDYRICAVDKNRIEMLKDFLNSMQSKCKTFVTSATFGSYDYSQLALSGTIVKDVLFGDQGDPLGTNTKLTIFADTKSYTGVGRYSTHSFLPEIKKRCIDIMNVHGPENCLIICRNKNDWYGLKKHFESTEYESAFFSYYRAPEVMGIESERRVGILVGLAHKPKHAFDVYNGTYLDSQILREESMHADVWQALSRVKDPNGEEPSVVYGLGCSLEDMQNVVNWGINRKLEIKEPFAKKQTRSVEVTVEGDSISRPKVLLKKKWRETIMHGILCKNYLYSKSQKVPNIKDYFGTFRPIQYKINYKCSLLNAFFGHIILSSRKKYSNRTFSKEMDLTDKLLMQHTDGKTELYFNSLQPDNTVNFILFESEEEYAISQLKLYLDSNDVPYVIEKLGNLLRIWILTENTPARNAKNLGQDFLRKSGCNAEVVEVYPKQIKRNPRSKGDLIRMPFGSDSQILVNGKFVDNFEELEFGHLEISYPSGTGISVIETNNFCDTSVVSAD